MWWRFWRWPRPPMDPLVAMALLVRGMDREHPDWDEISIMRVRDEPQGGVRMRILRSKAPVPSVTEPR